MFRFLLLATVCAVLGACEAEEPRDQPHQYLDEHTAATITAVDKPLVFARDRTELAANARDYVTLAAAAVDRMGKVQYLLVAYSWSTVDSRLSQERAPVPDSLDITADDRRILFTGASGSPTDAGIAAPVGAPPGPERCGQRGENQQTGDRRHSSARIRRDTQGSHNSASYSASAAPHRACRSPRRTRAAGASSPTGNR